MRKVVPFFVVPLFVLSFLMVVTSVQAALNLVSLSPASGAVNVCYDTHLQITFDAPPSFTNAGRILIYNSMGIPVDTNDLSLGTTQTRKLGNPGGVSYILYPVLVTGNTATIYPHPGVLTNGQTYYVNIQSGLFTNKTSGSYTGITDSTTWSFSTKPAHPPAGTNYFVVAADNSGDFATLQGVMDFIPSANTQHILVFVRKGVYQEVDYENQRNNVTFRGEDRLQTLVTYPNNNNLNPSGSSVRTMIDINANDVAMENLTLSNSTPVGGSQAEALRVSGQRFIFNNGNLDSFQDTFLINSAGHYAYFYNSHVQGDVDFVWNDGCVVFQSCEIEAMNPGYNCQMRTPDAVHNGSVYLDCSLTKARVFTGHYLARIDPNVYPFSATAYINCKMDTHITAAGWLLNNYTNNVSPTNQLRFWEYQSTDLNSNLLNVSQRIAPSIQLNAAQATLMRNLTNVFGWLPQLAPNVVSQPTNLTVALGSSATFTVSATGIQTTNPAVAGGASVILPLNYQWYKNQSVPIAGATNAVLTLANVQHPDMAAYSVIVSNATGSVTSSVVNLTITGDSPPVASPATYYRNAGWPLQIPLASLATNWSDSDNDTVTLTGVNNSTNGATVTYDTTNIYYSDSNNVADQFNYTIGDGFGGSAVGIVNVLITPGSTNINITGATANSDGSITLNFTGIPNYSYWVETTTNLAAPVDWEPVSTNLADTNGMWQVIDSQTTNVPQKFYRVVQPPLSN